MENILKGHIAQRKTALHCENAVSFGFGLLKTYLGSVDGLQRNFKIQSH